MTFDPAARRTAVVIEPDLLDDLTEIAHARSLSVQTLVNVWLRQAVDQAVAT